MSVKIEPVTPVQDTRMNSNGQRSDSENKQLFSKIASCIATQKKSERSGNESFDYLLKKATEDKEKEHKKAEEGAANIQRTIINAGFSPKDGFRISQSMIDMLINPWDKNKDKDKDK